MHLANICVKCMMNSALCHHCRGLRVGCLVLATGLIYLVKNEDSSLVSTSYVPSTVLGILHWFSLDSSNIFGRQVLPLFNGWKLNVRETESSV